MAVKVTTYNPTFHVTITGTQVQTSTPFSSGPTNFFYYDTNVNDVFKEAIHSIQTTRRIGSPASFSIQLFPNQDWDRLLTLMSYVKIYLSVDGVDHIVFRGFITSIDRSFSISGGKPQEYIVLNGSDWQKIALYPVYYIKDGDVSGIPIPINIMAKWIEGTNEIAKGGILHAVDAIEIVMNEFFQPMIDAFKDAAVIISDNDKPKLFDSDAVEDVSLEANLLGIIPLVETRGANNFEPNTSIWELFNAYQARPWRELFFDDYDSFQYLIYRSTPWRDINANFLAPNLLVGLTPISQVISPDNIISYSLTRSDLDVYNSFITYMQFSSYITSFSLRSSSPYLDGGNNPSLPFTTTPSSGFTPSDWRLFGIRFRSEQSVYLGYTSQDQASDLSLSLQQQATIRNAASFLNQRLTNAMNFNDVLESGSVTINGNPLIHIGQYIALPEKISSKQKLPLAAYYVEGLSHSFTQPAAYNDGSFLTTLMLTRGEGYLNQSRGSILNLPIF